MENLNTKEQELREVFSNEVISIVEEVELKGLLKDCRELRSIKEVSDLSTGEILINSLKLYRSKWKCLANLKKKSMGVKAI